MKPQTKYTVVCKDNDLCDGWIVVGSGDFTSFKEAEKEMRLDAELITPHPSCEYQIWKEVTTIEVVKKWKTKATA
jgi:hypothetical protein